MKRVVTVLLSISLLVGGSVYALQPDQSQPARAIPIQAITDPSKACEFSFVQTTSTTFAAIPGNNTVTVDTTPNFPDNTDVVLEFSAESRVSSGGTSLGINWSVDGGPFALFGPEFLASNVGTGPFGFETHTSKVIVDSVSPRVHTFTVGWKKEIGPGEATVDLFFRCLQGSF